MMSQWELTPVVRASRATWARESGTAVGPQFPPSSVSSGISAGADTSKRAGARLRPWQRIGVTRRFALRDLRRRSVAFRQPAAGDADLEVGGPLPTRQAVRVARASEHPGQRGEDGAVVPEFGASSSELKLLKNRHT